MKGGFTFFGKVETTDFYCEQNSPEYEIKVNKSKPYIFFKKIQNQPDKLYYYKFVLYIKKSLFSSKQELVLKYTTLRNVVRVPNIFLFFSDQVYTQDDFNFFVSIKNQILQKNSSQGVNEIIDEFNKQKEKMNAVTKKYNNNGKTIQKMLAEMSSIKRANEAALTQEQKELTILKNQLDKMEGYIRNTQKEINKGHSHSSNVLYHQLDEYKRNRNSILHEISIIEEKLKPK
jgi:hypothetical protein